MLKTREETIQSIEQSNLPPEEKAQLIAHIRERQEFIKETFKHQKAGSLQQARTQTPVVIGPQTSWIDRVRHALTYREPPK